MSRNPIQVDSDVWAALKKLSAYYNKSISEIVRAMLKNGGAEILKTDAKFKAPNYKDAEKAIANL